MADVQTYRRRIGYLVRLARWKVTVWFRYTDLLVPNEYRDQFDPLRRQAPPRPERPS